MPYHFKFPCYAPATPFLNSKFIFTSSNIAISSFKLNKTETLMDIFDSSQARLFKINDQHVEKFLTRKI